MDLWVCHLIFEVWAGLADWLGNNNGITINKLPLSRHCLLRYPQQTYVRDDTEQL
jgi:hypothetical protein